MKISACYIVKNEAANLAKSLSSLREQTDEIIVVDTGSTDNTRAVAENFGAKVFEFAWQNDFAAARNAALAQATGDWIVFLDADEYFTPETKGNLRKAVETNRELDALAVKLYNIDNDAVSDEPKIINSCFVLRAFRRSEHIRYQRRIHEGLVRDNGKLNWRRLPGEMLTIYHTGYSAGVSRSKAERNLALLRAEIDSGADPAPLYRYLAECYEGLDDYEQAIKYALLDIADGPRNVTFATRSYRLLITRMPHNEERLRILEEAVKYFPQIPEFHAELAEQQATRLNFSVAANEMESAIKTYHAYEDDGEGMQFDEKAEQVARSRLDLFRQIKCVEDEIKIFALCMVKNEADELPRWLENVAVFADKVLVLDTGSTDGTVTVAESAGATVYHYPWQNDFAAARNSLLDRVGELVAATSSAYVIFLDADETFFAPSKVRPALAKLQVTRPQAGGLIVPLINVDADAADLEISREDIFRLWRYNPNYRYEGRIHEALYDGGKPLAELVRADEPKIRHTGYSSGRVRAKLVRNLNLLLKEAESGRVSPLQNRYLAECYYGLGDYEAAIKYARAAVVDNVSTIEGIDGLYHLLLNSLRANHAPLTEQLAAAESGLAKSPDSLTLIAARGNLLAQVGETVKALDVLREFYRRYRKQGTESSGEIVEALTNLAKLDVKHQNEYLNEALNGNPFAPSALSVLTDNWLGTTESLAQKLLSLYQDKVRGESFLLRWSEMSGHIALYRFFAAQRGNLGDDPYALAAQGKIEPLGKSILVGTARNITALFDALIIQPETWRRQFPNRLNEWRKLLPSVLDKILARLWGETDSLAPNDWDGFWLGLHEAVKFECALPYALMARDFSPAQITTAADFLWEKEKWEAALELYALIGIEDLREPGKFWYRVGVSLYHTRQNPAAGECFAKAREYGYTPRELTAYELWSKTDAG